jgi:hypothetical protein
MPFLYQLAVSAMSCNLWFAAGAKMFLGHEIGHNMVSAVLTLSYTCVLIVLSSSALQLLSMTVRMLLLLFRAAFSCMTCLVIRFV